MCLLYIVPVMYTFTSYPAKREYNVHLEVKGCVCVCVCVCVCGCVCGGGLVSRLSGGNVPHDPG